MSKLLTWSELVNLPIGTLLVFPDGHDIYPHCIVPNGTLAIVADGDIDIINVLPADPAVCQALLEWDGCVSFSPINDGYSWSDESPVALIPIVDVKFTIL